MGTTPYLGETAGRLLTNGEFERSVLAQFDEEA